MADEASKKKSTRIFPDAPPQKAIAYLRNQFASLQRELLEDQPFDAHEAKQALAILAKLLAELCHQMLHLKLQLDPDIQADDTIVNPPAGPS